MWGFHRPASVERFFESRHNALSLDVSHCGIQRRGKEFLVSLFCHRADARLEAKTANQWLKVDREVMDLAANAA